MTLKHGSGAPPYSPEPEVARLSIVYPITRADLPPVPGHERALPLGLAARFALAFPPIALSDEHDRALLSRLRSGDHAAFDAIFRQWYEPVVRSATRVLHDTGVAEELAQDVFLELWRRRESLAADSSVAGYLMQSVRNRSLNHLRHLAVQKKSVVYVEALSEPAERADAQAQASELQAAMREAIADLPPRTREVFLLSRERGLRYSEIAEQLGVSVKAVEASMSRALRILRERLAPWMADIPEGSS